MRARDRATTLLRTATLLGALACACTTISLPCLGQEHRPAAPEVDTARPKAWTGRWIEESPGEDHPSRDLVERIAREQRQWWEEAQARIEAEGTGVYAGILGRRLAELRLQRQTGEVAGEEFDRRVFALIAAGSWVEAYPGRWEFLREVRLDMGKLAVNLGFHDAALFMTSGLLFSAEWSAPPYEMVPASDELLAEEAQALKDPRLVAFRASLQDQTTPAPAPVGPVQGIDAAVRKAVEKGAWQTIRELGSFAVEPLAVLVAENPEELPDSNHVDALYYLFGEGELRGARLALELWERGGIYFKKRVLRGIREVNVLSNPGTWTFVQMSKGTMELSTQPPRMEEPIWLEVLARLLADPDSARDSLGMVGYVAYLDGLDGRLQRGLIRALDEGDADMVKDVLTALEDTQGRASVIPVLEHALDHGVANVRAFAAERLALYPRSDALRARADHPDLLVRRAVADSLAGRVGQATYRQDQRAFWSAGDGFRVRRSVDDRDLACLKRLLRDEDDGIRKVAAQALQENPDLPVPSELILELARGSDADVRESLALWRYGQPGDPSLLELLAADPDPDVLEKLDRRLQDLATQTTAGARVTGSDLLSPGVELLWNDRYLDALRVRLANRASPPEHTRYTLLAAGRSPVGATALMRQAVASGDPLSYQLVLAAMDESSSRRQPASAESGWQDVPAEDLVAFVRGAWEGLSEPDPWKVIDDALQGFAPQRLDPLRGILRDDSAPADLRVFAAEQTRGLEDAAWRKDVLALLVGWTPAQPGYERATRRLRELPTGLPAASRIELLRGLLRAERLDSGVRDALQQGLVGDLRLPPELALEVLERWGDEPTPTLLGAAISALPLSAEEPRLELVRRLLANPWTVNPTIDALGRAHLDAHLPLLEAALVAPPGEGGVATRVQVGATSALASYLSDGAAEILIKGLGATTNTAVRDACFAALETIRRYQDEKERWALRRGSKQARAAAVAELVPMLADADANVRAQAAKSLGALGAVEHLPALVRMLKDADAAVRTAAQQAIDVLTRPEGAERKD